MNSVVIDFNYFDMVIGSIVVILSIKGFLNGVIKEFFGILGLIGGVFVASRMSDSAATFISTNLIELDNQAALKLIGFISVLAIFWLASITMGSIFSSLTKASGFGFINRLLGFILGGGKYFLIFALIVTALSNITLIKDNLGKYVDDSILYPYLKKSGSFLINMEGSSLKLRDANSTSTPSTTSINNLIESGELDSNKSIIVE